MQANRNIRNEIYIALGSLVVISFALVFAIILSGSIQEDGETTPDTTEEVADTEVPTDTATSEIISTEELTEQATAPLILLSSPSETATEVPPSDTVTPSPTDTATASEVATETETATATLMPTSGSDIIRLDTALAPVATDSDERAIATATLELNPTETDTDIPPTAPPSPTVAAVDEPSRTPASCSRPSGWTTYEVQAGNTLFAIALATGSTVDELKYVNCIANIDNIIVGQVLYVPRKPSRPVSTPAPANNRGNLYAVGCGDTRTHISNLQTGQTVHGLFNVYGSAYRNEFWYYKIEIRPDWAVVYNFFSQSGSPVQNGLLTTINPEVFGTGVHWIRLSVVNATGLIESDAVCEIPVIFG